MFKYGKKAGYMGIALLVLAVIPLVVAAFVIPNIGPEVATKFNCLLYTSPSPRDS